MSKYIIVMLLACCGQCGAQTTVRITTYDNENGCTNETEDVEFVTNESARLCAGECVVVAHNNIAKGGTTMVPIVLNQEGLFQWNGQDCSNRGMETTMYEPKSGPLMPGMCTPIELISFDEGNPDDEKVEDFSMQFSGCTSLAEPSDDDDDDEYITCGMVEGLYREQGCCGNPNQMFNEPEGRRLSRASRSLRSSRSSKSILDKVENALKKARQSGDDAKFAELAGKIRTVVKAHRPTF